jgi:hypothetical protein
MAEDYVPPISSKYFCIAGYHEKVLTAIVSSYLVTPGEYLPVFGYPSATAEKKEDGYDAYNENYLSSTRAEEFAIRIFNSLQRTKGCEYLILVGLTAEQKSFLYFLDKYNVIEISSVTDAELQLKELSKKTEHYPCSKAFISQGLFNAVQENKILTIDENAGKPELKVNDGIGMIVAEDRESTSSIIAVNYALSAKLNFKAIEPPELNRYEVSNYLNAWKTTKDDQHFNDLSALIYNRIEDIDFDKLPFATFFTECVPYSLILKNKIPFTYVNSILYPDFFIFNNIWMHHNPAIGSAVVFSPLEFKDQEETAFVIKELERHSYLVMPLVGKDATPYHLSHFIEEFPYELFHICSHGGEIQGTYIIEKFNDLEGNEHSIEYDEVVSFSPTSEPGMVAVTSIQIWRKLDGLMWKSKELKEKNYPHSLYGEMVKKTHEKRKRTGSKIDSVEGSSAIKCHIFNYQAHFNSIAGATINPIIFNNTCWSWQGISTSFLHAGCRGYIGTLWAVDNNVAVSFAESFYGKLFEGTVVNTFYTSMSTTDKTDSENIYVYWGLHFTRCAVSDSRRNTRFHVTSKLVTALENWNTRAKELKKESWQIEEKRKWISKMLEKVFPFERLLLKFMK